MVNSLGGYLMNIQELFSNQTYAFKWKTPLEEAQVSVKIPDIRKSDYQVWGDWGPMYTFQLDEKNLVEISYNDQSYTLDTKQLKVESPTLFNERKELPFYISIKDSKKGLKFNLFLDRENSLKKVDVYKEADTYKTQKQGVSANNSERITLNPWEKYRLYDQIDVHPYLD